MGRYATVAVGSMRLLLSERAGWTSDPATFRFAGLPVDDADVIVVRSCSDFRANFPTSEVEAVVLDVPGTAQPETPRVPEHETAAVSTRPVSRNIKSDRFSAESLKERSPCNCQTTYTSSGEALSRVSA